jgi:hypothetical protein
MRLCREVEPDIVQLWVLMYQHIPQFAIPAKNYFGFLFTGHAFSNTLRIGNGS